MTGAASSNRERITRACKRLNTFQAPWPPPGGDAALSSSPLMLA